ncbi:MAG: putative system TPR-repeat lipoprotein [Planctomycetaceae bacterium]|nr:putative system TPR-repeat lipoprotein [Planctomycetaceae bacterium]
MWNSADTRSFDQGSNLWRDKVRCKYGLGPTRIASVEGTCTRFETCETFRDIAALSPKWIETPECGISLSRIAGPTLIPPQTLYLSGSWPRMSLFQYLSPRSNVSFLTVRGAMLLMVTSLIWMAGCGSAPSVPVAATTPQQQTPTLATTLVVPRPSNSKTGQLPLQGTILKFRDVTQDWGVHFTRYDDIRGENRIMEVNGGGIAVFDYDLDGQLDLFFTQGGKLPLKKFNQDLSNELFRNRLSISEVGNKTGNLESVTASARLTATGFHTGCAVGDIDADGFPDLYINAYGRSSCWLNAGDGTFRDVTESAHVIVDSWGSSVALADFNGDGWLDIYIVTYVKAEDDPPMICRSSLSPTGTIQCPPTLMPAVDDLLFVNDQHGGFINASKDAGITTPDGKGLGVVAVDVNGDGKLDIHVANDGVPSFLYINETPSSGPQNPSGAEIALPRFQERGSEWGIALNGEGRATSAMGIAAGDYDRDGWIDLFVTNFYLETNTLYRNLAGQGFADLSSASRLGPPSRSTLAFGTEFFDIDHDGWLDLVITTGHIEDLTWKDEPYRMRPHLFRNERNGRFSDVAETAGSYFAAKWVGRSLATGDIDRDGDLDLVMAQQLDPSVLLLNETPAPGTSVIIKAVGRNGSPRSGIGTRITAHGVSPVLMRVIAGGGGFQSASAQEIHLPLGEMRAFEELVIDWPDGKQDRWKNVLPGFFVAIEGQGLYRIP